MAANDTIFVLTRGDMVPAPSNGGWPFRRNADDGMNLGGVTDTRRSVLCAMRPMPRHYGGGSIRLRHRVMITADGGASADQVRLETKFERITTNYDVDSARTWGAAKNAAGSAPTGAGTAGQVFTIETVHSNAELDSVVAGDFFVLSVESTAPVSNSIANGTNVVWLGCEATEE